MGIKPNVKPRLEAATSRSVKPNSAWLTLQVQMRAWSLRAFSEACSSIGQPVSEATLSAALNGHPVDRRKLAAMIAAIRKTDPVIPEEAIA